MNDRGYYIFDFTEWESKDSDACHRSYDTRVSEPRADYVRVDPVCLSVEVDTSEQSCNCNVKWLWREGGEDVPIIPCFAMVYMGPWGIPEKDDMDPMKTIDLFCEGFWRRWKNPSFVAIESSRQRCERERGGG